MRKLSLLALIVGSSIFLGGWHGGCRQLTPEEKAARLERHSTAMVDDFMDDVDADLKQRAQAQTIRKRIVTAVTPQILEQEKAKQFAIQQWDSNSPDKEQIHRVVDERVDGLRKVLHLAADGIIELHGILTPDQRAELSEEWKD
jgi:periplasmic protein CpxP/Spy